MEYDQIIADFDIAQLQLVLGIAIGLIFGLGAALSQFCIRAMVNELSQGRFGHASIAWILGAVTAYLLASWLLGREPTDISEAPSLPNNASISGPILGGLLFGMGMIISRGCSSRLLILTAYGNMRAPITLLAFALSALLLYSGQLAYIRVAIQDWWRFDSQSILLPDLLNLPVWLFTSSAIAIFLTCLYPLARHRAWSTMIGALLVGVAVALGWASTAFVSYHSFGEIMPQSISFTAPMIDTLSALMTAEKSLLRLGTGLLIGTIIGSAIVASCHRDWHLETFHSERPLGRYVLAGCMMGFGAVLAGGCSIGAGLSGTSVLAGQATITLLAMTVGGYAGLKAGFARA